MKRSFLFVIPLIASFPVVVSAHGAYAVDERMAAIWGSPWAQIGIAVVLGALAGGGVFFFRRDRVVALKAAALAGGISALALFVLASPPAETLPIAPAEQMLVGASAVVYKSESCNCCAGYIEELKRQGADVTVEVVADDRLEEMKAGYGLSPELYSCHTSIIDGYVVEGHVPIEAVKKLITEKPDIPGIALPGMPSGTPGMAGPKLAPYEIKLLDGKLFMQI